MVMVKETFDATFAAKLHKLLDAHTPNLTEQDEKTILSFVRNGGDAGDFAHRTCRCGEPIDGFYEYVEHLRSAAGLPLE